MKAFTRLLTLVSLCAAAVASPTPSAAATSAFPTATSVVSGLHALAKAAGKLYFGTATDNPELTDTPYVAILDDNMMFGQITAANSMKWDATEPEQGVFTFDQGDVIRNLAQGNGQLLRGHNCVWHEQLPDWVAFGNFTFDELISIVENHCGTLVGHYTGQILDADKIRAEPFNDDGTFQEDVFFNTTGTAYIPAALNAARAADANAKLYINEFNIEFAGPKATALQNLITQLKADGVPIDGVGFQSHFIVGEVPGDLVQNFQSFVDLGVEFAITELDVRMTLPETDELLAQQKQDYETVINACLAFTECVGVTIWDFTDKFSWVPGAFPSQGAACPWDDNLVRKPAFDGIVTGFQG
ncbi:glycoside hydrolase family 10 protein [Gelatoporia subvermispora B]|uniref:Beta-xylanase n=1 Tax=Ceriporiopsis subvermispora (strain B) TaxID=914234 RepID=M2PHP3_CERS8|nr:glycoside hydrolase family 10 protein [Gelatoporia subvermispora B]